LLLALHPWLLPVCNYASDPALLVAHLQSGSFEFSNARAAMVSPLAKKLFMIDGVTGKQQLVSSAHRIGANAKVQPLAVSRSAASKQPAGVIAAYVTT
jgi:hypothetical protein